MQIWAALARRGDDRHRPDRCDRRHRQVDGPAHGGGDVISRAQTTGFWLSALGALAALALPLSSETVPGLTARPALLAAVLAAAALFALAPFRAWLATVCGFLGVLLGCAVTLRLLADPGIAGSAASGFWLLTLATWLAAALTLTCLASLRSADRAMRGLQDLAIPLLFGAFLVYLWEVAVRGFGVPSVLMPAPSATARGSSIRCRRSARTLFRLSCAACCRATPSAAARAFSSPSSPTASISSSAGCCRSAISSPRCRSSASRRSW